MVPFAGYEMPVQYGSVLEETTNVRKACGLFDVSHMGQFSVRGKNSLSEVLKLVSNDLRKLSIGQAQYNMLCNESGGVIDDLVVYRRSEDHTYICVNASNRLADRDWMKAHLAKDVSFTDESDETALIAIQGPQAEAILTKVADSDSVKALKYYWAAEAKIFGISGYLSRTGYTGEDGYELYVPSDRAVKLWNKLLEVGAPLGLKPTGLGARDTLRLEMGYPLHGHEINPEISPLAAGLGWVVKLERDVPFFGQAALIQEAKSGSPRKLKALTIQDRRIARQGYKITDKDRRPLGDITSGTFSPHLNSPIAMGFVEKGWNESTPLFVEVRDNLIPAQVVKLPFVKPGVKK